MKKLSFLIVAISAASLLVLASCGDGRHFTKPGYYGNQPDPGVAATNFKCVNVVNFGDFEYDEGMDEPITQTPDEAEESEESADESSENASMLSAIAANTIYINPGLFVDPDAPAAPTKSPEEIQKEKNKELRKCVKDAVDEIRMSGKDEYWASLTWIVVRDKNTKVDEDKIELVDFHNCEQVEDSACIITNFQ